MQDSKKFLSKWAGLFAIAGLVLNPTAANASVLPAQVSVTLDGVVYTLDNAGSAFAAGFTADLPAELRIADSVTVASVDYPVTEIGEHAFDGATVVEKLTIPSTVTSIGKAAFASNLSLVSLSIPESVKSIGDYAFDSDGLLSTVTIPNSVTQIGAYAFKGLGSMTSLKIGGSVTSIGDYAFYASASLPRVTIPDSVSSIGSYSFASSGALVSVALGKSLESIGDYAFASDVSLASVAIPNSVKKLGAYAFYGDSTLASVSIGNSLENIEAGTFYRAGSLVSVSIPDSVKSIANYAFAANQSLTTVTIPDSVTSLGDYAFYGAASLVTVKLPATLKNIGEYAFASSNSLSSIVIPDSVTSLGKYAFACDGSLVSLVLSKSLTSIEAGTFYANGSLLYVIIPASVTSIGNYAFAFDRALNTLTFRGPAPTLGKEPFTKVPGTVQFYSRLGKPSGGSWKGFTFPKWQGLASTALDEDLNLKPAPSITGLATVGATLTAVPGAWDSGVTFTYQWKRSGVAIAGEVNATYLVAAKDLGSAITVTAFGSKPGYLTASATSLPTAGIAPATLKLTPAPVILGKAKLNKKLTAKPGVWESGVALTFQWKRAGIAIKGATKALYKVAKADVGKALTVLVTGSKVDYATVTVSSKPTAKAKR